MEIKDVLDKVDKEFRRAIKDPEGFEFSERDPYFVEITEPEHYSIEEAVVDLENQNVQVRYKIQEEEEYNKCVMHEPTEDIALVESKANHQFNGRTVNSTNYYLVNGGEVYARTGFGWEETIQDRPLVLVDRFDEFYRQAIEIDNEIKSDLNESTTQNGPTVPPPDEGFFTE